MRGLLRYTWLEDTWRDLFHRDHDRRWSVAVLYDLDLALRDGIAHQIIRDRLGHSARFRYTRAYNNAPSENPGPGEDFLFVGRTKLHIGAPWGEAAKLLDGGCGRFLDQPNGLAADTVVYGSHQYSRRHIEGSTPQW